MTDDENKSSARSAVRLTFNKKRALAIYAFSFVLSLACVSPSGLDQGVGYTVLATLFFSIPFTALVSLALVILNRISLPTPSTGIGLDAHGRKVFLIAFVCLVVCWALVFAACYPGICSPDSQDIFKMILGMPFESDTFRYNTLNSHHPLFYIAIISVPLKAVQALGLSEAISVALVSLLHLLILALCCSYFLGKAWILTRSKAFVIVSLVFFLCNPLMMLYSVTVWKDVLFAGAFLVLLVELLVLVRSGTSFFQSRSDAIILVIATLFSALLRNNALYALIVAAILLCILLKQVRKQLLILFGSVLMTAVLVVGPISGLLGVAPGHFVENVSIPLQQISVVAATGDSNIDSQQYEYLNELLPYDEYANKYNPISPDPIKFSPDFNDSFLEKNKLEFFSTYLQLGLQNPKLYIRAWIDQTKSFWSPEASTWYIATPGYTLDGENNIQRNLLDGFVSYDQISALLGQAVDIFEPLYNNGSLAWIMLFTVLALTLQGRKKLILCIAPLLLLWLTFLIAAPANDFRYMFPVHLALPFLLLIILCRDNSDSTLNKS